MSTTATILTSARNTTSLRVQVVDPGNPGTATSSPKVVEAGHTLEVEVPDGMAVMLTRGAKTDAAARLADDLEKQSRASRENGGAALASVADAVLAPAGKKAK